MDKNIKIAKQLVRLAKSLVANKYDSLFFIYRDNSPKILEFDYEKTQIDNVPYKIKELSKTDLTKYITITDKEISFRFNIHSWIESYKNNERAYPGCWAPSREQAEIAVKLFCQQEAMHNKKMETHDDEEIERLLKNPRKNQNRFDDDDDVTLDAWQSEEIVGEYFSMIKEMFDHKNWEERNYKDDKKIEHIEYSYKNGAVAICECNYGDETIHIEIIDKDENKNVFNYDIDVFKSHYGNEYTQFRNKVLSIVNKVMIN